MAKDLKSPHAAVLIWEDDYNVKITVPWDHWEGVL